MYKNNLGEVKEELETLKVEMEKYHGVTKLTAEHLSEIGKFNNPDTITKILGFNALNGNLENFSRIFCEVTLLVQILMTYLQDVMQKLEDKIEKDPELKKARDLDNNKGNNQRKQMILLSNILLKLNIVNVSDLRI